METKTLYFRQFVRYTGFNVLAMTGLSCYILADTFFVSKALGASGLAALNLALPVYSLINGSGLMIGMGGGTQYAITRGRGNDRAGQILFTHSVYLAGIAGLLFFLAGLLASPMIVTWLGANEEVFSMTETYLSMLLLFAPVFLMNNVMQCFVRNDGAPQLSMAAMLAGSLSNIILDYVFMFPFQMGIFGAVLATGLSPLIGLMMLFPHLVRRRCHFRFRLTAFDFSQILRILSCGVPAFVTECASGIVMMLFNATILGLEGNIGVAAYGIVANIALVVTAVYTGLGQGLQPLLSHAYGKGNGQTVRRFLRYGLRTMLLFSILLYGFLYLQASPLASVFNGHRDPLLQAIAVKGIRFYFTAAPFIGFNILLLNSFTSINNIRPAHVVSLLRGAILPVPVVWFLAGHWGMNGVWCAVPAAEIMVAAVTFLYARVNPVLRGEPTSKDHGNTVPAR